MAKKQSTAKHRSEAAIARLFDNRGFNEPEEAAAQRGMASATWRVRDAGNLQRIAIAMERIAGYQLRQTKVMEEREARDRAEALRIERERAEKSAQVNPQG